MVLIATFISSTNQDNPKYICEISSQSNDNIKHVMNTTLYNTTHGVNGSLFFVQYVGESQITIQNKITDTCEINMSCIHVFVRFKEMTH